MRGPWNLSEFSPATLSPNPDPHLTNPVDLQQPPPEGIIKQDLTRRHRRTIGLPTLHDPHRKTPQSTLPSPSSPTPTSATATTAAPTPTPTKYYTKMVHLPFFRVTRIHPRNIRLRTIRHPLHLRQWRSIRLLHGSPHTRITTSLGLLSPHPWTQNHHPQGHPITRRRIGATQAWNSQFLQNCYLPLRFRLILDQVWVSTPTFTQRYITELICI